MVMTEEKFRSDPILTFDWTDDESVCAAVIRAVAAVSGADPKEMGTLYSVIDPDALNALFASRQDSPPHTESAVEFLFEGFLVRVLAAGNGAVFEKE